jgi:tetratricopeptide (TPR) repeat protein
MSSDGKINGRLTTWKRIGSYIGRDESTAKRYERERQLPVHRMPGAGKSTVFALTSELDAWLQQTPSVGVGDPRINPQPEQPLASSTPRFQFQRLFTDHRLLAAACIVLLIALAAPVILYRFGLNKVRDGTSAHINPEAREIYNLAEYAWQKRTAASLQRATDLFTQAIVLDPKFGLAYAGLADCYNLMPEFGGMSAAEAYPRSKAAAERAIQLDPKSAAGHRSLAFVLFWWSGDAAGAVKEFQTSLVLDPSSSLTHHWYANVLASMRNPVAAKESRAALMLDPYSTPMRADDAWVQMMIGHPAEAIRRLNGIAQIDPTYSQTYDYRASAEGDLKEYEAMLRDLRRVAELHHDPKGLEIVSAAEQGLSEGGPVEMLKRKTAMEEAAYARGDFSTLQLAGDQMRLGNRQRALQLLKALVREREPGFSALPYDPLFAGLETELQFQNLIKQSARAAF